jgi:hypothetical protein
MAVQFAEGLQPIGGQPTGTTGVKINQLLYNLALALGAGGGAIAPAGSNFAIPAYNSVEFTYDGGGVADDENISTQTFKQDGATVATLTYTYWAGTNNIQSITQS